MHTLIVVKQGGDAVECPVCGRIVELLDDGDDIYVVDGCDHLLGCDVEQVDGGWEILVPVPDTDDE